MTTVTGRRQRGCQEDPIGREDEGGKKKKLPEEGELGTIGVCDMTGVTARVEALVHPPKK